MNLNTSNAYLEIYKVARNSVEHFDKILGGFRQIIFALDGVSIMAVATYYVKAEPINYRLLFWASFIFIVMQFLVWQLEKHYHRYLIMSAKIAEGIERRIFYPLTDLDIALTCQLREARNVIFSESGNKLIPRPIRKLLRKASRFIRTYDLLYIIPILISIFAGIFFACKIDNLGVLKFIINMYHLPRVYECYLFWALILCPIYFYFSYLIIYSMYWFSKYYHGTEYSTVRTAIAVAIEDKVQEEIARIARSIYDDRMKRGFMGDAKSDWHLAEIIYGNRFQYSWWRIKRFFDGKYTRNRKWKGR